MENVNRESIAAKINALLSKTIENGCSEAEAMLAMKKATDLMAKYEFNLTQAQLEAGGIDKVQVHHKNSANYFAGLKISTGIAAMCEVRCWRDTDWAGRRLVYYFGLKSDIQLAKWMHENLSEWMVKEAGRWWHLPENYIPHIPAGKRSELKKSFVIGCGERISQRMFEEVKIRNAARQKDRMAAAFGKPGTSIVPVETMKKEIVAKGLAQAGINLRTSKTALQAKHEQARGAGYAKGNDASWAKPIGGNSTLQITGRK